MIGERVIGRGSGQKIDEQTFEQAQILREIKDSKDVRG